MDHCGWGRLATLRRRVSGPQTHGELLARRGETFCLLYAAPTPFYEGWLTIHAAPTPLTIHAAPTPFYEGWLTIHAAPTPFYEGWLTIHAVVLGSSPGAGCPDAGLSARQRFRLRCVEPASAARCPWARRGTRSSRFPSCWAGQWSESSCRTPHGSPPGWRARAAWHVWVWVFTCPAVHLSPGWCRRPGWTGSQRRAMSSSGRYQVPDRLQQFGILVGFDHVAVGSHFLGLAAVFAAGA